MPSCAVRSRDNDAHCVRDNPSTDFIDFNQFAIDDSLLWWIGDYDHFTCLPLQERLSQFTRGDGIRSGTEQRRYVSILNYNNVEQSIAHINCM